MFGTFSIVRVGNVERLTYIGSGDANAATGWRSYVVPKHSTMALILCVGSGAGGGGGSLVLNANGEGGGGGAGPGWMKLLIPTRRLPRVLYLKAGAGGLGGGSDGGGEAGQTSYVCSWPNTSGFYVPGATIARSEADPAGGGEPISTGGLAANIGFATDSPYYGMGANSREAAPAGNAGGPKTGGAGTSSDTSLFVVSGGGGGGSSGSVAGVGGSMGSGYQRLPTPQSGGAAGGTTGGDGEHGILNWRPPTFNGGCGGGGGLTTGGNGGNGAPGCAGGGGGGGNTTGGNGGNGGPGFIMIWTW